MIGKLRAYLSSTRTALMMRRRASTNPRVMWLPSRVGRRGARTVRCCHQDVEQGQS